MVCDGGLFVSTVASFMMNGVCCMWQMQNEDDRRECIRTDLRSELLRQRRMDYELWKEKKSSISQEETTHVLRQQPIDPSLQGEIGRRQQLLRTKMALMQASSQSNVRSTSLPPPQHHHYQEQQHQQHRSSESDPSNENQLVRPHSLLPKPTTTTFHPEYHHHQRRTPHLQRLSLPPFSSTGVPMNPNDQTGVPINPNDQRVSLHKQIPIKSLLLNASLLDNDDDDEEDDDLNNDNNEEEISSMVEIVL